MDYKVRRNDILSMDKDTLRKCMADFMVEDTFIDRVFAFDVKLGNSNIDIIVFDYAYLGYSGLYGLEIFTKKDTVKDVDGKVKNLKKFCFKLSVVLDSSDTDKIKYIQETYKDVGMYLVEKSLKVSYSVPEINKINKPDIEAVVENMCDWQLKILDQDYTDIRELLGSTLRENGLIMDFWAKTLSYRYRKNCNYIKNNIDNIDGVTLLKAFKTGKL